MQQDIFVHKKTVSMSVKVNKRGFGKSFRACCKSVLASGLRGLTKGFRVSLASTEGINMQPAKDSKNQTVKKQGRTPKTLNPKP